MELHDLQTEFVYMDSFNCLCEGAEKCLKLLDEGKIRAASDYLKSSLNAARVILEHKIDLSLLPSQTQDKT